MQPDLKLIDRIPADKLPSYLSVCITILTDASNPIGKSLPHSDKLAITKLLKLVSYLCKLPKRSLLQQLDKLQRKDMLRDTIGQLYFNRTLNNYQLIKAHFNRERLPEDYSKVVTRGETGSNLCVKMEYRIEVTLSSHKAKKVLRPLILLVFTMEDDEVRSFYVDVAQFQEIRKHVALGLRNLHQIESKG